MIGDSLLGMLTVASNDRGGTMCRLPSGSRAPLALSWAWASKTWDPKNGHLAHAVLQCCPDLVTTLFVCRSYNRACWNVTMARVALSGQVCRCSSIPP